MEEWLLKFPVFYTDQLRTSLFSGFLTIGTFLFAIKTFLVVKIKEEVLTSENFIKKMDIKNRIDDTAKINPDSILVEFTEYLYHSAMIAFICSIINLIFGSICHWSSVALCTLVTVYALFRLIKSMVMVKENLDVWIKSVKSVSR
jgi:hypothetical protein